MARSINPMKNVLLVSVFITNKSLNPPGNLGHSRTGSSVERLEIFLTSLRSWSKLQLENPYFFIELDDDFEEYKDLVASEIESNFINPLIEWKRLLYFEDWAKISAVLKNLNVDLITLLANDDHAYVHPDSKPFKDFSNEVIAKSEMNNGRALGDLTHFPGPIRTLSLYSSFNPDKASRPRSLVVKTIHGCCLVTPKLFVEWWAIDFTNGTRIPRPDNPFGPSVEFMSAHLLIPSVEILRHMDGLGEGTRISRKYNVLRPSLRILIGDLSQSYSSSGKLVDTPWKYGLWPSSPNSHRARGGPDLYRMFPQSNLRTEHFRIDLSRLIVAYQKAYAPELSRELIIKKGCSNLYLLALNIAVLLDFSTFFNFLIWFLFDLPNKIAIKLSIIAFGKNSIIVTILQKIRNRIFQHLGVRILKVTGFFSNS